MKHLTRMNSTHVQFKYLEDLYRSEKTEKRSHIHIRRFILGSFGKGESVLIH